VSDGDGIHLAFPDGTLVYDCDDCDQRCCRTGKLSVQPAERQRLVRLRPALELVAPPVGADTGSIATPPSGCWFLDGSRCELVSENGGAMRPLACTLFPFDVFALHGESIVVAPNPLCPLRIRKSGGIGFRDVMELLGSSVGPVGAPPTRIRYADPPDALALEVVLRDAAGTGVRERTPFALFGLVELATRAFVEGGVGELAVLDLRHVGLEAEAARLRWERGAHVLGFEVPDEHALTMVTAPLAAWMPSLRLLALEAVPLERLGRAFESLGLLAARWSALRPGRALLPQTLSQLAASLAPLCDLVGRWDEPWSGPPLPELGAQPGTPLARVEAALAPAGTERQRQLWTLAETIEAAP
jgi:hypothetical protein